jgi:predicted peroxiredoxin
MFAIHHEDLIPECDRVVGGAALIEAVMETDARVLTY